MIKILIMDDSRPKTEAIKRYLTDDCLIPSDKIDTAITINEGRKLLTKYDYDLLLLDLVMPLNDDSEPDAEESPKFIDEIYTSTYIHIPIHIIGFSQFDDLLETSKSKFEDKLWHLLKFDLSKNDWKTKLQNKIQHLIRTKEYFSKSLGEKYRFDYGVICALDKEFSLMQSAFMNIDWKKFKIEGHPFIFYSAEISTMNGSRLKIVSCCVNEMGMQATAVVSALMFSLFELKCLFMTGICAGIEGKVNMGDIIIAERIFDYGSGKLKSNENGEAFLEPSYNPLDVEYELLGTIHHFLTEEDIDTKIYNQLRKAFLHKSDKIPQIVIAPTACGSYVVANSKFANSLKVGERKLAGVEMEGYGLYKTGYIEKKQCLMVKSVCDFANEAKGDDYQNMCAFSSASFVYFFLKYNY
ncbi:hypothetical protein DXB27_17090 [Parabacteroides gordonii]|uniref:Response regulatory domain-containing protein n=2 Tax=Parabacteroides gordonii TaxID=574930 RepID=A0A0F5J9L3_9BACT|nr:hypothetical protein HMPREF1536_03781 [Parabacteroides gordonii MS-1 = DSM 23371]RGP14290.1 hypothetical protein DXB27_17090 [Parabacteroides gordonii]